MKASWPEGYRCWEHLPAGEESATQKEEVIEDTEVRAVRASSSFFSPEYIHVCVYVFMRVQAHVRLKVDAVHLPRYSHPSLPPQGWVCRYAPWLLHECWRSNSGPHACMTGSHLPSPYTLF